MTKVEFQDLLERYKAGKCSSAEIQKLNRWFDEIADEDLELNEFEKTHVNDRIRGALLQSLPSAAQPEKQRSLVPLIMKIAAGFTLTAVVGFFLLEKLQDPSNRLHDITADTPSGIPLIEHHNTTTGVMNIILPDSSSIELQPNATVSYGQTWNEQVREVHLVGEAFFDVVKDSKRPFFVYGGGEIVTKVLGTSFTVKAAKNAKSVEVRVHTGKVSVYEDPRENNTVVRGDASGVILTPNERVEYFVEDKHWVTSLVQQPKPLPASNKAVDFVFSDAPMNEIKESIERTYSIDIIIENEASYSACTFTGDVSMMELYDLLDVICKSTGTNYEVKGTKILISGSGCQ
jgi:transmembrane sensor